MSSTRVAFAEEGDGDKEAPVTSPISLQLNCRVFRTNLEKDAAAIDTSDRLSEIGQWVGQLEDQSMQLHSVDFEIGQKATNFPQGWIYVCMSPKASGPVTPP
jgi:hypothetical protein